MKTNLCELVELLNVSTTVVFGRGELRREQGIDEGRLAQPRFTYQEAPTQDFNMLINHFVSVWNTDRPP
jgi:hypothetical protein